MQSGSDTNAFLIDVSKYQNTVNWSHVAQAKIHGVLPVKATLIRASQGLAVDPRFTANLSGATAAGLYRGVYHSILPQGTTTSEIMASATAQATFFYNTVHQANGWAGHCLNPGVDIEVNPSGLNTTDYVDWVQQFLSVLARLLGKTWPLKPMLYLNLNSWETLLGRTQSLHSYPLWVAQWGVNAPTSFGGWADWLCWQWSSPGPLAGIQGNVDYDEWHSPTFPDPIATASSSSSSSTSASGTTTTQHPSSQATGVSLLDAWQTATTNLIEWAKGQL